MGDVRFAKALRRVTESSDPVLALSRLSDAEVVSALAAAGSEEPYLANVLATELHNRLRRISAVTGAIGDGIFAADLKGCITYLNETAQKQLGWSAQEALGVSFRLLGARCDRLPGLSDAILKGGRYRGDAWFTRSDGAQFPAEVVAEPMLRDGERIGTVVAIRNTRAQKLDAAAQSTRLAHERAAREQAEAGARHALFLLDLGRALADATNSTQRAHCLAHRLVPTYADICAIHMLEDDGLSLAAVAAVDPAVEHAAREYAELFLRDPAMQGSLTEVLRTGRPILHAQVVATELVAFARDEHQRQILEALNLRSLLLLPLTVDHHVLGAISLVAVQRRAFREGDIAPAMEIASYAAVVLEEARRVEREAALRASAEQTVLAFNQALIALRREKKRADTLLHSISGALWTTDATGCMTGEQPSWGLLTGQRPAEYLGMGWLDAVVPDHRPEVLAHWSEAVATKGTFAHEFDLQTALRGVRKFLAYAAPLVVAGRVVEWIGVAEDVTDVRRAEAAEHLGLEAFHALADAVSVPMWTVSPDGAIEYVNRAAQSFTRRGEPRDAAWLDTVHPDERPRVETAFRHALAAREAARIDMRVRSLSGWRQTTVLLGPRFDASGTFAGLVGVAVPEDLPEASGTPS